MHCQSRKNLKHLILKNQNIYHICSSATIPTVASVSLNSQFQNPPQCWSCSSTSIKNNNHENTPKEGINKKKTIIRIL